MRTRGALSAIFIALSVVLGACAPAASSIRDSSGSTETDRTSPKRLTAAIMGEPKALGLAASLSAVPGEDELSELVLVGLSTTDTQGRQRPRLAEAVPTTENGLWTVFPDGRMETRWKLRADARWHDGAPFTAEDLVFSGTVNQDAAFAVSVPAAFRSIDRVEAPDPATFVVHWKQPFPQAHQLWSSRDTPLPKHLLAASYSEDKTNFMALPYWTDSFVGNGPFEVREWVRGSHVVLRAYGAYAPGRPRIDEIEVRFIPDQTTLLANMLAGTVHLAMGRGIGLEEALQLRDQWREGDIKTGYANPVNMFVQFGAMQQPASLGDPRVRRALLHAIDRPGMVQTLLAGLSSVAYAGLRMSDADRAELEPSITRYEYDERRAAQLLQEVGYSRGPDGKLRDSAGQLLGVDIRANASNAIQPKSMFVIADNWQRLGVEVEPVVQPPQILQDPAYKIDFRSFRLVRNPVAMETLENYFHTGQIPTATNNYRGSNYGAYQQPELDALIRRLNSTAPRPERVQIGHQIVRVISDQVPLLGLFYDVEVSVINNRVKNVLGRNVDSGETWNAEEWDVN